MSGYLDALEPLVTPAAFAATQRHVQDVMAGARDSPRKSDARVLFSPVAVCGRTGAGTAGRARATEPRVAHELGRRLLGRHVPRSTLQCGGRLEPILCAARRSHRPHGRSTTRSALHPPWYTRCGDEEAEEEEEDLALKSTATRVHLSIQDGSFPPDYEGKVPLHMLQHAKLFGTARIAKSGRDAFPTFSKSKHVAVLANGSAYELKGDAADFHQQ